VDSVLHPVGGPQLSPETRKMSLASGHSTRDGCVSPNVSWESSSGDASTGAPRAVTQSSMRRQRTTCSKKVEKASRIISDHEFFSCISVALTCWALVGDDLRMAFTDYPTDFYFSIVVLVCLAFFISEMIVFVIGKTDYFLSFFFCLDFVSTCSLILDLTWVSEGISEFNAGQDTRGGKTARIGASLGRMVRVVRLIRVIKLYKAYYTSLQRKWASRKAAELDMDQAMEDSFWQDDETELSGVKRKESNVGKKLSSLTIRRVIVMVLTMLLVLPNLSTEGLWETEVSSVWGVDNVWRAFQKMEAGQWDRRIYENEIVRYIYYHSWFDGQEDCKENFACASDVYSHLFFIGIVGKDIHHIKPKADMAALTDEAVVTWEDSISPDHAYSLNPFPTQARKQLASAWTTECNHPSQWGDMKMLGVSLLAEKIEGTIHHAVKCPTDLRREEFIDFSPVLVSEEEKRESHILAYFDKRKYTRAEAKRSMWQTAFVCIVLCGGFMVFARDANVLVLGPLEGMMHKVNIIQHDPLVAMQMADLEYQNEEKRRMRAMQKPANTFGNAYMKCKSFIQGGEKKQEQPLETAVLEKTIIKLGSLLALGFGEAGASIVSTNMRGKEKHGVNAMIPGHRVDSFIGTCRLHDFSSITQALQGKVLVFVNQVAEIVHGVVDQFHGAANKNNGDSFLLVWRTSGGKYGSLPPDVKLQKLADFSVLAIVNMISALHRSRTIARYRGHPRLQQRLGSYWRVNSSFSLHFGWAIEGAVGSEFKIDASYLSPTVRIAESIENATKSYGLNVIISESVISHCSKGVTDECRPIDRVAIKGSKEPIELYTVDLDCEAVGVERFDNSHAPNWGVKMRFKARQLMEVEKRRKWSRQFDAGMLFKIMPFLKIMRDRYTTEFVQTFCKGYRNYQEAEWEVAQHFLQQSCTMLGVEDGPSRALLDFMERPYGFVAPANWRGVRELPEEGSGPFT